MPKQINKGNYFGSIYLTDPGFDYHVKFEVQPEEEANDFTIKIKLLINEEELIGLNIIVKFTGGEFSSKLSAKYKFQIPDNFNYLISKIEIGSEE